MLIFSQGMIRVRKDGSIALYGVLARYEAELREFFAELELRSATVKYRNGGFRFSTNVDEATRQRIRNFLVNLPAFRKLR